MDVNVVHEEIVEYIFCHSLKSSARYEFMRISEYEVTFAMANQL